MKHFFSCIVALAYASVSAAAWQPATGQTQLQIWPDVVPDANAVKPTGDETTLHEEKPVAGRAWLAVTNVTRPTMTIYPPKGTNSGAAVVVFPGGGYRVLAMDLEGTEVVTG